MAKVAEDKAGGKPPCQVCFLFNIDTMSKIQTGIHFYCLSLLILMGCSTTFNKKEIARYPLDERNVIDVGPKALHGSHPSGVACEDRFKQRNRAIAFKQGEAVQIQGSELSLARQNFTISCWVSLQDVGNSCQWLNKMESGRGWSLGFDKDLGLIFRIQDSPEAVTILQEGSPAWIAGEWQHVVVVRSQGLIRLYRQTQKVASDAHPGLLPVTSVPLQLGNFSGSVDDLRFYAYAMAPSEIKALAEVNRNVRSNP